MLNSVKFNFSLQVIYRKVSFVLLFVVLFIFSAKAQKNNYKISEFTLHDGLSNTHVKCIAQDAKGFIWIGTEDGLNRFDGKNFINYFHYEEDSLSLMSSAIYSLLLDNNNNLWIGTFAGLCRYDYNSGKFIPSLKDKNGKTINTPIKTIKQGLKNELWLGTNGEGLIKFNTKTNEYSSYKHRNKDSLSIASNHISEILVDDNEIWVGNQDDGISILNLANNKFTNLNEKTQSIKNNTVLSIFKNNKSIWVGTFGGGISIFNSEKELIKQFLYQKNNDKGINSNIVYDIKKDRKNRIWLGTEGGSLNLYDNKTDSFQKVKGLINNKIRCIFEDKEGNIWLGIHQGGVNMISKNPSVFEKINISENFSGNSILGILEDKNDRIWIGTDGEGLHLWNKRDNLFQHFSKNNSFNSIRSNVVRTIYQDRNNNIWLGTYLGGISKFNPELNNFKTYVHKLKDSSSLSHNDVTAILEDRIGNLWFSTNGGGLNLFNPKTETFRSFKKSNKKNSIISNWIISLYIDKTGFIWIGTYWGVCKLDPLNYSFNNLKYIDNKNVYFCFYEDSENRFWAGTWNGLKLINKENGKILKNFTIKDGLPNNVINGILEDEKGNLWISTNNGLSSFNYRKLEFTNYFQKDGLQSNEFIHGAFAKGNHGKMYFGGINGITLFSPSEIKFTNHKPSVVLTDFLIFNKSVKIGKLENDRTILQNSITESKSIELNHNDNSFSFEFAAIEYNLPEKIQYACRMKGFNDQWSYYNHNKNSITYTNLDYGKYIFEVKASNSDENWGKVRTLEIIIHPPIWLTWWAYLLYFILFVVVSYFVWYNYQLRLREKNKIREERLQRQKEQEIDQEKLQFFTNISHEFRTPLTLIIGPLESLLESSNETTEKKQKFELMHRNANRLLRLINQLMDLRKLDSGKVKLNAANQNIVAFLNELHLNFKQLAHSKKINFYFKKEFEELNLWFDEDKMDKIFFNLLSNAFKFTSENESIFLEIGSDKNPNFVAIKVRDTGKGIKESKLEHIFERFFQGDNKSELQQGTGIGLWLTENYVKLHSGQIFVESTTDKGTSFTLLFPKGDKHLSAEQKQGISIETSAHLQPTMTETFSDFTLNDEVSHESETKQTILLVEDDDEIRNYLKQGLKSKYKIDEAVNGKEGMGLANENLPDLIITDVMMPEMDGIELCKRLKTNIQTCHIPVIMLTAKTSIEHRIEGLETGADSYIPKPFNPRHLSIRIKKLLELRKRLIQKFSNEIGFAPEKMAITSADDKLLQKVSETVKEKIADTDLNVETLSEKVGMSRGHLQRKLKSLTGQNPNEFIRIMRLKQAAEIIKTNDITVSEVTYMVGFSSPSYFSTCFTKQFNISPTQFKEQQRK